MCIFLAHDKLKKVIAKCKSDAATISNQNDKLTETEIELENITEKFKKAHEAQKLAEVKVMELEQRLSTESTKVENFKNEFSKSDSKLTDVTRQAKDFGKRVKELEKDKKQTDSQVKQLQMVITIVSV